MAQSPWSIDRTALTDLLRRAGVESKRADEPRARDPERVHFPEQGSSREAPPAPRARGTEAPPPLHRVPGTARSAATGPAPRHLLAPAAVDGSAPLFERLETFVDWLLAATGASAAFVADEDGLPLVSRHVAEEHVAVSAALDGAMFPVRRLLAGEPQLAVVIELDGASLLEVLWVSTPSGRLALGVVMTESLARSAAATIRATLHAVCVTNERGT
ncbi:MAG: hypothetical protein HY908_10290 [Myxococcales bacterium]|nr:hypothetical protein [Myxococcales bacterium]